MASSSNPNVPQGTLNRLRASLVLASFPTLNITPSFLGPDGMRLTFGGPVTGYINTMTGAVTSLEPFQKVELRAQLIKTQSLAAAYKLQIENSALLGDGTVRPDLATSSPGLGPWQLSNMAIESVEPVELNGVAAWYILTLGGYYSINQSAWNG